MTSRLREAAPIVPGVMGGLVVLGAAVVLLVTFPGIDALLPASSASPLASAPPSASPSPSESPSQSASGSEQFGLQPGQLAPPLEVDQLGGGTINLAGLRGKAVWLNFLGSWCPPCYDELPRMESYWLRLKDKGLVIVGIDIKETPEDAAALVKQTGITFPVGVDPSSTTEQFWSSYAMPVHFWIDRDGVVRSFAFGGIDPKQMEAGLSTVLPEEFPTAVPGAVATPTASP
jgi:cytochrome c biogenesis protein CcmG, thiol:disulfide interchange protein DsbE